MNTTDITQPQTEQQPLIELILNRAAGLTGSEFKIAALLYAAIENGGGAAEMTIAELAKKAGMSWRSAQESRARLIRKGIVAVTSGGREKSRYRLPEAGLLCPGTPKIEPRREIGPKPMREAEVNAEIDRLVFELAGLDRQRAAAIMPEMERMAGGRTKLLEILVAINKRGARFSPRFPRQLLAGVLSECDIRRRSELERQMYLEGNEGGCGNGGENFSPPNTYQDP